MAGNRRKREATPDLLAAAEMIARLAKLGLRTDDSLKKLDLGRFVAEHIDELTKEELKLAVHLHQAVRQGKLWELLTSSVPLPEPEIEVEPATAAPVAADDQVQAPEYDGFQF